MIKTCACGTEFEVKHRAQIHCTRDCINERNHNSPVWNEKQRDLKYKIRYGITIDDYNRLFEEQLGSCKICKRHQSLFKKALHVDHNHETGKVRGLLCHSCNAGLGRFKENPVIIAAALEYVS